MKKRFLTGKLRSFHWVGDVIVELVEQDDSFPLQKVSVLINQRLGVREQGVGNK